MPKMKLPAIRLTFLKKFPSGMLVTAACIGSLILAIAHLPEAPGQSSRDGAPAHGHGAGKAESGLDAQKTEYTCSMHPAVRRSEPGKCPICNMDLIPVSASGGIGAVFSGAEGSAGRSIGWPAIETVRVERRQARKIRRLTGRIVPDSSSRTVVASWVDGRVEKSYVRFEGERVRAWQPVALLFSPVLTGAQAEFLALIRDAGDALSPLRQAGEMRLANMGMTPQDIRSLVQSGQPSRYHPVYASSGGIVVRRNVYEGSQIRRGDILYEIVDDSRVWLEFDVPLRDAWICSGQILIVRVEGLEEMPFRADVDYTGYQVDAKTRTFVARATVENIRHSLRFGAWVWAEARQPVSLAEAEKSGSLMVPASAVLYTGKRSVVYVADTDGGFSPREVEIGPEETFEDGAWMPVLAGLFEGESVARRGAFVIDSNRRIQGLESMMARPQNSGASGASEPLEFVGAPLDVVFRMEALARGYFAIWKALSGDDAPAASMAALALKKTLGDPKAARSPQWEEIRTILDSSLVRMIGRGIGLAEMRKEFSQLSDNLWRLFGRYGFPPGVNVVRIHCPMAFDNRGANWLQPSPIVENPYFGREMLRCGSVLSDGTGGAP